MVTVIELHMKPQGTKTMTPSPPYRASHYGRPCKDSTSVTSDFEISRRLDSLRICSRRTKGTSWLNPLWFSTCPLNQFTNQFTLNQFTNYTTILMTIYSIKELVFSSVDWPSTEIEQPLIDCIGLE